MKLIDVDASHSQIVAIQTPELHDEVRVVFYMLSCWPDGKPVEAKRPNHLRVFRLLTVQGIPGEKLRYNSGMMYCNDPGELHMNTQVIYADEAKFPIDMNSVSVMINS